MPPSLGQERDAGNFRISPLIIYISNHTEGGKKETNYTTTTIEERNHKRAAADRKEKQE
jgi:hypothetical protein